MANEKKFTSVEVATAVLGKVSEVLQKSELMKAQVHGDMSGGQKKGPQGYGTYQEQAQNQKGVHTPVSGVTAFPGGKGTSEAGGHAKERYAGKALPGLVEHSKDLHRKKLAEIKAMPAPKLGKSENPDKDADAELGEKVEKEVEEHMLENKAAEKKEGHKILKSEETENKKAPSKPPMREEKQEEKSDDAFKVEGKNSKSSNDPRLAQQTSPGANPKEAVEGNNEPAGSTPKDGLEATRDGVKGHLKLAKFIGRMEHKRSVQKNNPNLPG